MSIKQIDTNALILAYNEINEYLKFLKKEEENNKKDKE